jgi:mannose-6-phosphate isomerase-like protein (cupin superfamily)
MKTTNEKLVPKKIKLDSKERYTRLFSTKNGDALSLRCGHVTLQQDESIGEHNTENSEEVLVILRGKGELYVKGYEKLMFEKDTALYVPPNTIHNVRNTGKTALEYIFITSPL